MTAGRPRRAGVLGSPIAHSLSPVLHRAAYAALGLDWAYDVVECDAAALPAVLAAFAAAPPPGVAGVSLTMPLKSAAWRLVAELAPSARAVGAVNTVLFGAAAGGGPAAGGSGEVPGGCGEVPAGGGQVPGTVGHNTDVTGLVAAVREAGFDRAPAPVVLLGGGGAARAGLGALARLGAGEAAVVVRDPARAEPLAELGRRLGLRVRVAGWASARREVAAAALVVATTPPGATDGLAAGGWPGGGALVDVCYAPWPTALGRAAAAAGVPVVGGLAMLVGQAAEAVELMTGRPAPVAAMRAAGEAALAARAAGVRR